MNPVFSAILGPLFDLLKQAIPDANARAAAQEEITRLLISNEAAVLDAAKTVMAADAASEGWLTRNARPIVVMWSLAAISAIMVEAMTGGASNIVTALRQVPGELWNLLSVGIGGYMLLRTGEKITRDVAQGRQQGGAGR